MLRTTAGQLLVNDALPPSLRRYDRVLDKKGLTQLFTELAEKHPDAYRDVTKQLHDAGLFSAQSTGTSVKLSALVPPPAVKAKLETLRTLVRQIGDSDLSDDDKEQQIVKLVSKEIDPIERTIYEAGLASGNPFAEQVKSGSRGNATQLRQLIAGDLLVSDHRDRVLPVPVLHGYAQGLDPVEYFAASYGARKGVIATKEATRDSGYLAKQLASAAHRLVVTEQDCGTGNGIRVQGNDPENVGSVLAVDAKGYKAGTIVTSSMAKQLGEDKVMVRSPVTCRASKGLCAKCAGVRDRGRLPEIGDNVGLAAVQSVSEKLSQGALSTKHGGGAVKGGEDDDEQDERMITGFKAVDQMVQVPDSFQGAATVASVDGRVTRIEDAPQGGQYVYLADSDGQEQHYVPPGAKLRVKSGDVLEAGDAISSGVVNPSEAVKYKGVGAGRVAFVKSMGDVLKDAGVKAHRRNLEIMSRALIKHVRINDVDAVTDALPDDLVDYDTLASRYVPRHGAAAGKPKSAVGRYLEQPILHYSLGTRVTPSVAKDLEDAGVGEVLTHNQAPSFEPRMVRAMEQGSKDPDPVARLGSSYLERSTLEAAHRARTSQPQGTSFVPSLAKGDNFGSELRTKGMY
jgi:DNA-directed RNA polymerase subunit beta'